MVLFCIRLKNKISSSNSFNNQSQDEDIVRCQRIATRIYFILFLVLLIGVVIYLSLTEKTTSHQINSPNRSTIENLHSLYPDSINCPCNEISIPLNKLINDQIIFHEICSSDFISTEWIEESYQANITYIWPLDVRTTVSAFSQILRSFCLLSNTSVTNARISFASQSLITRNVLSSDQFLKQIQSLFKFVRETISTDFNLMRYFIYGILEGNQLISGLQTNVIWQFYKITTIYRMFSVEIIYGGTLYGRIGCPCSILSMCNEPAGLFFDVNYSIDPWFSKEVYNGSKEAIMISGWKGGCYPLESLLLSTLECYYNLTCINLIVPNHKNIKVLNGNSSSQFIEEISNELFIDQWNSTFSYDNYLSECHPKFCTYSSTNRNNFIEIIIILFGIAEGLNKGLKFFVEYFILCLLIYFMKRRKRRIQVNPSNHQEESLVIPLKQRLTEFIRKSIEKIIKLNLFSDTIWIRAEYIQRQIWSTRLFFICILFGCITQTIFLSTESTRKEIIILSPNESDYENLLLKNVINLNCPCENQIINYEKFININPLYHQICSSKFIDNTWFLYLSSESARVYDDFRWSAKAQFRLLSMLCNNINETIDQSINQFKRTPFVNPNIINQKFFKIRTNDIKTNFIRRTTNQFNHTFKLIRSLISASQYLTLAGTNGFGYVTSDFLAFYTEIPFDWSGLSESVCYCSRDIHCQTKTSIYYMNEMNGTYKNLFTVPGFITACFPIDSIVESSLECLYNLTCVDQTLSFFPNRSIFRFALNSNVQTRFNPETKIKDILNELFIEDWQIKEFYSSFYNECHPTHCIYSITTKNNLLFILTRFIIFYQGFDQILKIILPHLINFISKIRNRNIRNHDSIISKIVGMNIFRSNRNGFMSIVQQRRLTRVYLIIIILFVIIFGLYKGIREYPVIEIVKLPNEDKFQLFECSSSLISIEYQSFINISYSIHSICSSDYLKKNFTDYFFNQIDSPLLEDDFRSHAMTYFHLLNVTCSLTNELLIDSLKEFSLRSLINNRILTRKQFHSQIESIIIQFKQKLSVDLIESLTIFQDYVQGNQLITLTNSNWKFQTRFNRSGHLIRSIPIQRSNCSCATSNLCFNQAKLYLNDNETVIIEGIQIGCTPLNSLFHSTLQCFYQQSCINHLIYAFQIPFDIDILQLNQTKYSFGTNIQTLIENLFQGSGWAGLYPAQPGPPQPSPAHGPIFF